MARSTSAFAVAVTVAISGVARLVAVRYGHNFDTISRWVVAGHLDAGQNVYTSTTRYRYVPVRFWILDMASTTGMGPVWLGSRRERAVDPMPCSISSRRRQLHQASLSNSVQRPELVQHHR